jgi:hypothetical protein
MSTSDISKAAAVMGRKGGKSTFDKKKHAARRNGLIRSILASQKKKLDTKPSV